MVFGPPSAEDFLRSLPMSLRSLWNICIWRRFGSLHFINKCLGRQRETDGPSWNQTLRPPKMGRNWNPKGIFGIFKRLIFWGKSLAVLNLKQLAPESWCPASNHWKYWNLNLEPEKWTGRGDSFLETSGWYQNLHAVLACEIVFWRCCSKQHLQCEIHLSNL